MVPHRFWFFVSFLLYLNVTLAQASLTTTYFTASGTATPGSLMAGQTLTVTGTFTARQTLSNVNIDLEVRDAAHTKLLQKYFLGESFASGQTKTYTWTVVIPTSMSPATYSAVVSAFNASWSTSYLWYEPAATFQVVASGMVPSAPTGLTATANSSSQITLAWTDTANNETGFKIERSPDGATFTQIATVGANGTTYVNTSLSANTQYWYRVRATNAVGDSAYSNVTSATTAVGEYFGTLAPGTTLPEDCAARVRPAAENRPDNITANETSGITGVHVSGASTGWMSGEGARVNGSFTTGTTDEILQWAACKWGLDEDIQRARAVQESSWHENWQGDYTTSGSTCALINQSAPCYQSYGILQIKGTVHTGTYPTAAQSTPFNADYSLAWQRACFEGDFTWLGGSYHAGDIWGCVGAWFSGRWYDAGANNYISLVRGHLANRTWESY